MKAQSVAKLLDNITPGPWVVVPSFNKPSVCDSDYFRIAQVSGSLSENNAKFIAASRQLVPELLMRVAELELALQEMVFATHPDAGELDRRLALKGVQQALARSI